MTYKLISAVASSNIFQKADLLYYQGTLITTGVVGDPYGFERNDRIDVLVGKAIPIGKLQATLDAAGEAFIAANYPNII